MICECHLNQWRISSRCPICALQWSELPIKGQTKQITRILFKSQRSCFVMLVLIMTAVSLGTQRTEEATPIPLMLLVLHTHKQWQLSEGRQGDQHPGLSWRQVLQWHSGWLTDSGISAVLLVYVKQDRRGELAGAALNSVNPLQDWENKSPKTSIYVALWRYQPGKMRAQWLFGSVGREILTASLEGSSNCVLLFMITEPVL